MPTSPWSDLDRPPLREASLRAGLVHPGCGWTSLRVLRSTGSTNADLVREARSGDAEPGAILVAEEQTAGRGRLGRDWVTPARAALAVSVLLDPGDVPAGRWSWIPLLTGVAVAEAVGSVAEVEARLKWPNDVLVDDRKLGGILAQRVDTPSGARVVVGMGVNVSLAEDELPVPEATSLLLAGATTLDRDPLLRSVLRALDTRFRDWVAAGGDPGASGIRADYLALSATIGRPVRVRLPSGAEVVGTARAVDTDGALVVSPSAGGPDVAVTAGDVVQVRPAPPATGG